MNDMNEKGFSLVEVLVAITLLAIGLLAVAGMQSTAISGNAFAQSGTAAFSLAQEMVDRVRTNAGTRPDRYHDIDTDDTVKMAALPEPAKTDAEAWKSRIESRLPQAVGTVTVNVDNPLTNLATVTVEIQWDGDRKFSVTTLLSTWGT